MADKQPTQEQVKEFWEWYGARCLKCRGLITSIVKPDRCNCYSFELDIDLNNLFKYAVPKPPNYNPDIRLVQSITFDYGMCRILDVMGNEYVGEDEDPALALFWALDKVKEVNNYGDGL